MQIVFRTDASTAIGSGHVVRCLTLANALRQAGGNILFVCRAHEGHLADWIAAEGHEVVLLPQGRSIESGDRYSAWLGVDLATDAVQTLAAIPPVASGPRWVIVDHYALDASWERRIGDAGYLVMAIDDIADRIHDCEILLDQNLVSNMENRYNELVSERVKRLLGPQYVLLQPAYRLWHERNCARGTDATRLLCYFGASDPYGLTLAALQAMVGLERSGLSADIVLGPYVSERAQITMLASQHEGITVHEKLPSLAELMVGADLALGAGGATSWERICLGLPALVVTLAENQRPIASALHERNLVRWLGEGSATRHGALLEALRDNLRPGGTAWFDRSLAASIDGRGTDRVVDTILAMS